MRKALLYGFTTAALLASAAPAAASPVATSDETYSVLGRVFPDPLAGCPGPVCSPNAQGTLPATQFIQYQEFVDGLTYMNQVPEWSRYMEVWPLASGQFAGNNLPPEFDPKPEYVSAGLPTSDLSRKKSDLYVVRVTDETVPDEGKKRYTLSLSIHGIERAGAEGGTRAMEDLVTAATTGKADASIVPESVDENAPSFAEVLRKSIVYFTYPNPDGWRRGSVSEGGLFFQRYNGNGVDPNRDWPDIGYSFRGYSGNSEPETRALAAFYKGVQDRGGKFAAGDDLHGQPFADALSFTLLPHGRHDYAKDERIRQAAIAIHEASEAALTWSPIIQENDQPVGGPLGECLAGPLGDICAQLYGQTWGTVYDTINYTTTGTLGDWFDSKAGLNADGIDNEMSFSHLDKNVIFDPHTEQLHVDGNKALIYAHLAEILDPPANPTFAAAGSKGYVPSPRLTRAEQANQPEQTGPPQAPIEMEPQLQTGPETAYPFTVQPGNGGMRAEVTQANLQGIAPSYTPAQRVSLKVQCQGCDRHAHQPGAEDPEGWVTVAEDYNQKQLYLAAGLTATVNNPQALDADGDPIQWRLLVRGEAEALPAEVPALFGATDARVEFTQGPASSDGDSGGGPPPRLAAYDVANTDFFADLDPFTGEGEGFDPVSPSQVIAGSQELVGLDSLVLADSAMPGYTGKFGTAPSGEPHADFQISDEGSQTIPGGRLADLDQQAQTSAGRVPGSYKLVTWTLAPEEVNQAMRVAVRAAGDFDIYLYRVGDDGSEEFVTSSATSAGEESLEVSSPAPGEYHLYVDNYAVVGDTTWQGEVTFTGFADDEGGSTGAYSLEEKDAWIARLRAFVEDGGNLVLTDGALLALPDLVDGIERQDVGKATVYLGQISFTDGSQDTTGDPLAADVVQPGARFNSGMRRQTYEPTPLGFAIQDASGADESVSPQFEVDRAAWEAAGGRFAAGSATSDPRAAEAVSDRVTLGELELGEGQIRIIGSLLPQPSQAYDHPLGIEPYAVTYTGYILARNLFDWEDPSPEQTDGPQPPAGGPGPGGPSAGSPKGKPKAKKCKRKRGKKRKGCKKK